MILKELITGKDFDTIWKRLVELYPDQEDLKETYSEVFDKLQNLTVEKIEDPYEIVIDMIDEKEEHKKLFSKEEDSLTEEEFNQLGISYDVSGRKSDGVKYGIEFVPWEEWLGMGISKETLDTFDENEIIAHVLWEMTFIGYEQEEIQAEFDRLVQLVNEIEEEYKQKQKT
mgnify:FL=1|jgi:hypothetical protein